LLTSKSVRSELKTMRALTVLNGGLVGLEYDPWDHASLLEVEVIERRLPPGWRGAYNHIDRLILLAPGMSNREARSTLAHEVQHAASGDVPSPFGLIAHRQELLADKRAMELLIDPVEYAIAEGLQDGRLPDIAHELNVTMKVLNVWLTQFDF